MGYNFFEYVFRFIHVDVRLFDCYNQGGRAGLRARAPRSVIYLSITGAPGGARFRYAGGRGVQRSPSNAMQVQHGATWRNVGVVYGVSTGS